jgi:hypothetical protein
MHIAHSRILSLHGIRFPRVNSHIYNNSLVQLRSSRDFSLVVATRTGKKKKKEEERNYSLPSPVVVTFCVRARAYAITLLGDARGFSIRIARVKHALRAPKVYFCWSIINRIKKR